MTALIKYKNIFDVIVQHNLNAESRYRLFVTRVTIVWLNVSATIKEIIIL